MNRVMAYNDEHTLQKVDKKPASKGTALTIFQRRPFTDASSRTLQIANVRGNEHLFKKS